MDNNSLYDAIEKIVGLRNFLEVKAPDKVIENAFLHDLQGNSIDCNIYHPKYGYRGFCTYETKPIVASFSNVNIYEDPMTGQKVYSPYRPFDLLCIHDDGKLTNKDGIEVKYVSFVLHNQKRLAENENDFQEIFDYWFQKKELNPQKQQDIMICAKFLISEVNRLQQQHEQGTNRDSVDLTLISLSNEFISFLESKQQTKQESSTQQQKGFDLGLSNEQLEKLYNELKEHRFIDIETNSKHFINAFNGKDLEEGFKPLKWIDETQRNHYISIQTVFQLLDSCNVSLKGENNIIPQVRETIKLIFENDFGNIQSKFNDFNALKTPRHILIDSKVKDLALNLNKI